MKALVVELHATSADGKAGYWSGPVVANESVEVLRLGDEFLWFVDDVFQRGFPKSYRLTVTVTNPE